MKALLTSAASVCCSLLVALQAHGQVQVAGTLLVNIDPSASPLGPISWVANSGSQGGVFEATGLATTSLPVVINVGGGTKGIMFDGNNFMQHVASPGGAKRTLPAALAPANAPYSIECWVVNPTTFSFDAETMVYWGVRNTAGAHTAFSYSANAGQGAMDHWGNNMNWFSLPGLGAWHHLVYTFDGTTQSVYCDGALNASETITGTLNPNTTQPITLAAQRNSDGSLTGSGGTRGSLTLGKVRIHSGVLSAAQVLANFNLEKNSFFMTPALPPSAPVHRYTFNNAVTAEAVGATVSDVGSPGGANATVRGTSGAESTAFTGTKLLLKGGSSSTAPYVDLPNGLLSSQSVSNGGTGKITLEGWVSVNGQRTWPRLFDIGNTSIGEVTAIGGSFSGANYFMLAQNSSYRDWGTCEIKNDGYNGGPNVATTRHFGMANDNSGGFGLTHYAVTWDEATGEVIVYENGIASTRYVTTTKFNGINDVNFWLGRSMWSGDQNLLGSYDEFRIYGQVLTPAQVWKSFQSGPDTVASSGGALQAIHLQIPHATLLSNAVDQLTVTGDYPSLAGAALGMDPGLAFTSSDTNIVQVSSNGLVQALNPGSATITVTYSTFTDNNTMTVITDPGALQAVRLIATNRLGLYSGQQAGVRGDFANVTDVDLMTFGSPTFSSANSNILVVSSNGLIMAVAPGTTTISASQDGISGGKSITVAFPTNRFVFDTFGDGFWTIVNLDNSSNLVVSSTGATQSAFTNGATDQQYEILYNLQNSTFRIRQRSSWLCIGPQFGSAAVGMKVVTINYTGTTSQQWYLIDAGNGYFRIVNALSGLAMQTDNGNPAGVTMVPASNDPKQLWRFDYQTHYPKKGTGGYDNRWSEFGISWSYNWDRTTGTSLPSQVVYEPMQWGPWWPDMNTLQNSYTAWHATPKPLYLLGFNEPDKSDQANMSAAWAITLWPQLQAMNLPLLSPAAANAYGSWWTDFFNDAANRGYRVDYTAAHFYVEPYTDSFIGHLTDVYNNTGRPVWLTEFSPVDWSNTKNWSEQGNYNFLAEFMWMAEDISWLKRYSIFLFSGTPSANPWDMDGHRGDFFQSDGTTLTPYGELYAAWDADRTVRGRTAYLIHNLGTSFRLTATNGASAPRSSSIRVRNATTEWALLPAPTTNRWYVISLNDGRRLRDIGGTLDLAPWGALGPTVEWTFTGPDSKGYYYISNPTYSHNLNGTGTAPSITFNTVASTTQNNNTRWRLVKPYQPVTIPNATTPGGLTARPGNQTVALSWAAGARSYSVYRATTPGGPYTKIANATTANSLTDSGVVNGVTYYYAVTSQNILAEESAKTAEVVATPSVAAAWRYQWFGTTDNSGNAADTADFDGDGFINMLERAFNLNPTVADTNGWPTGATDGTNFTMTYRKSLAATDLIFQPWRNFDLLLWSTNGITDGILTNDGTIEIHGASVPVSDGSAQYLRLQVTAP
ncbi:MAG TPA: glycosyl hydrolase [Candidatus Paceibacterota bacterium]|nr:glycosyl hydrolase [Candidatus Paceibacterota bacterium]